MNNIAKIALTATIALAITLTFNACEEKKKQDGTTTTEQAEVVEVAEKAGDTQVGCPNEVTGNGTLTCGGQTYKTVKIGEQVWMAENLNYETAGSKCYDNNPANCKKYGRLYDWKTAMKACPSGWHLPDTTEWFIMVNLAGGNNEIAGKKLKAKSGWMENGNGTDNFGFSALPGGNGSDNSFGSIGGIGNWWNSNDDGEGAIYMEICYDYSDGCTRWGGIGKSALLSVRCLQNSAADTKPAETAGESQPSGEEDCPDKKEPPITTEAVFLRNSENAEGIGFSTFRLPDGEEAMDFDEHNLEEGDKVSITYKSSGRYDGEGRCYYFKEVISVKKIGQ